MVIVPLWLHKSASFTGLVVPPAQTSFRIDAWGEIAYLRFYKNELDRVRRGRTVARSNRGWGIERVEFLDTAHSDIVLKALRLPFMLGTISILYGTK